MNQERPNSWKWNLGWLAVAAFTCLCGYVVGVNRGRSDGFDDARKAILGATSAPQLPK